MNDLISRQAAIDLFPNDALEWDTNCGYIAPHFVRRMIEELPSAQPEIIRCKDCKHFTRYKDCKEMYMWDGECSEWASHTYIDWFCSRAERK